jgi:hypothetical protein
MSNLTRVTRLLLLCFTISLITSSAQATILSIPVSDDLSIKYGAYAPINTSSDYITSYDGEAKIISYLKFNISGMSNLNINSVKLKMYGNIDPDSDVTSNNIGIFYVENDNWNEASNFTWETKPGYDDSSAISSTSHSVNTDTYEKAFYTWDLFPSVNVNKNELNGEITDGVLSLALQDINDSSDMAKTVFVSHNHPNFSAEYKPQLEVDYTPAPEPSSMLLGMLSLGGLFGFKRRRK